MQQCAPADCILYSNTSTSIRSGVSGASFFFIDFEPMDPGVGFQTDIVLTEKQKEWILPAANASASGNDAKAAGLFKDLSYFWDNGTVPFEIHIGT